MARMEVMRDVEVERPLIIGTVVGVGHEPVEDLIGEALIDDLRHVTCVGAGRVGSLGEKSPGVAHAPVEARWLGRAYKPGPHVSLEAIGGVHAAGLVVGAAERTERERVLIGGEEVPFYCPLQPGIGKIAREP